MLVVGIGNPVRGDDGVGPVVAKTVAGLGIAGVEVAVGSDPLWLLQRLTSEAVPDQVVVVDATAPRGEPGRLLIVRVGPDPLPTWTSWGSHGLGVTDVVELARSLGRLPRRLTLVGVEASCSATGAGLSAAVAGQVSTAVRMVTSELGPELASRIRERR